MVKKLMLVVFLLAMCFAEVGCYRGGTYVGFGDSLYYDGPYRNGPESFYYYDGAFYVYQGGNYTFHHNVPQDQRVYYDERYSKHHEKYHRDNPNSRNQHPGHPGPPPRVEEWKD